MPHFALFREKFHAGVLKGVGNHMFLGPLKIALRNFPRKAVFGQFSPSSPQLHTWPYSVRHSEWSAPHREAINTLFCPSQEKLHAFVLRGLRNISKAP